MMLHCSNTVCLNNYVDVMHKRYTHVERSAALCTAAVPKSLSLYVDFLREDLNSALYLSKPTLKLIVTPLHAGRLYDQRHAC
jgi:hypothetical protein